MSSFDTFIGILNKRNHMKGKLDEIRTEVMSRECDGEDDPGECLYGECLVCQLKDILDGAENGLDTMGK